MSVVDPDGLDKLIANTPGIGRKLAAKLREANTAPADGEAAASGTSPRGHGAPQPAAIEVEGL